ncbi:MAG: glycosyltransferase family 39 protein [Planctomyces sp.]|nr:glycosyltransferase family 39 protein [Planctomyces sp.]
MTTPARPSGPASRAPTETSSAPARPDARGRGRSAAVIVAAALLAQAALSLQFAATASVTHDEYWHLPVGVLYWRTGRFDWEPLNPPLLRAWAAAPVAASARQEVPAGPRPMGEYGDAFVRENPQTFRSLYFRGRVMALMLSLAASGALVAWTWRLYGPAGGALAAVVWCLNPNTIAHGALVTTDMAAVLGFVTVLPLLMRFAEQPTWGRALGWGAMLGAAQALKYTNLLLYPLCAVGWFLCDRPPSLERPSKGRVAGRWLVGLGVSLLVLNAAYLFQGTGRPLGDFAFRSQAVSRLQQAVSTFRRLPVPLPADFLCGIDDQRAIMEQQHPVYLDGQWTVHGRPLYYVKALVYKLPLGTLLLFGMAVVSLARPPRDFRRSLFLLAPAALLLFVASRENMQLGVRYVLPCVALGCVFVGRLGRLWNEPRRWLAKGLVVVAAAGSLAGLRCHPYHLAYFNEWAGGPIGGRERLVDSNLDWGQDLDGLKAWLDAENIDEIGLAYFGTLRPEAVGIRYRLPPSRHPEPGVYAVSVNYVMGRPHAAPDGQGGARAIDLDEFFYFRLFKPVARIGDSIDVYRLTDRDVQTFENVMRAMQRRR